ncbi:hypothetical protein DMUE_3809 [Dictyocoela muelleri]|nr:hypothetical protein DMUE_3809 [Dictyocoela muelleri]
MDFEKFAELLKEAQKKELLPYNHKLSTSLDQILERLSEKISEIRNTHPSLLTQQLSIKYILLKNLFERCQKIKELYKKSRERKIRKKILNKNLDKSNLSNDELMYAEKYLEEISNFYDYYEIFDYSLMKPPIDYFVQVLVNEDCVFFDDEVVELKKGRMYFLKRKLIEQLIENGYVNIL